MARPSSKASKPSRNSTPSSQASPQQDFLVLTTDKKSRSVPARQLTINRATTITFQENQLPEKRLALPATANLSRLRRKRVRVTVTGDSQIHWSSEITASFDLHQRSKHSRKHKLQPSRTSNFIINTNNKYPKQELHESQMSSDETPPHTNTKRLDPYEDLLASTFSDQAQIFLRCDTPLTVAGILFASERV